MMLRLVLLLFALLSLPDLAGAVTRYADGSIASTCGTYRVVERDCSGGSANGYKTIEEGLRALSAGDLLLIRAAAYSVASVYGNVATDTYGGGAASWAAATIISNYPGETYTITHQGFNMDENVSTGGVSYVIWTCDVVGRCVHQGSGGDQVGIRINNAAHHIRLQRLTIQGFTQHGISGGTGGCSPTVSPANVELLGNLIQNNGDNANLEHAIYPACSESWLVDGNTIKGNQGYGVHFYTSSTNWHRNARIQNNYIEGRKSGATGTAFCLVIAEGSGHVVLNNICNGLGAQSVKYGGCFQIYGVMSSPKLYNNTCHDVTTGVEVNAGVTGADIKNTIFSTLTTPVSDSGTSTNRANNLCPSAGTGCSVTGSPSFTNAGTGDFSLQAGSTAIDAGADVSGTLTTDFIGTARPQAVAFDIGAYELLAGVSAFSRAQGITGMRYSGRKSGW